MPFDNEVKERLEAAFADARLVFWEDSNSEFADVIGELNLANVGVLVAQNNEFTIKRRVLRDEPDTKFLLYRSGGTPEIAEDFLLDIKLMAKPFICTQASAWGDAAGLPPRFGTVINQHAEFFARSERRKAIKDSLGACEWMQNEPSNKDLEFTMLAICCKSRATKHVDAVRKIAETLLIETAKESEELMRLIRRCKLEQTLWDILNIAFGYSSENPTIEDFAFEVIQSACTDLTEDPASLGSEATIVLSNFAHYDNYAKEYEALLSKASPYISDKVDLAALPFETIVAHQYLPIVDRFIVDEIGKDVSQGINRVSEIQAVVARRRNMRAFPSWEKTYKALEAASFILSSERDFSGWLGGVTVADDCVKAYASDWYLIDTAYRHFRLSIAEARSKNSELFCQLEHDVEVAYSRYLMNLAIAWQDMVVMADTWEPTKTALYQPAFVNDLLRKIMLSDRVAVVISDAFRYEVGREWVDALHLCGKYDVTARCMLSALPSYTQLGMAALLPHSQLSMDSGSLRASVDGVDATGAANREKILQSHFENSLVIDFDDVRNGNRKEELAQAKLAYVYHNKIDAVGDKRDTEQEAFEAVQVAFAQLDELTEILFRAGFDTVMVTADHGFLYQQDTRQFSYAIVDGLGAITSSNDSKHSRRFVVAPQLPEDDTLIEFAAVKIGLDGDFEIGVPKGIRRLKIQGSGARFVHGGMTLQETLVPLVTLKKASSKRAGSKHPVQAQILAGGTTTIGGSTLSFEVYQTEPVGGDALPGKVRVALFDEAGEVVSEVLNLELSSMAETMAERKTPMKLTLAGTVKNNATVTLRIESPIGKTNKYAVVDERSYKVRRGFGNDFF